jgi:hypothetical protein
VHGIGFASTATKRCRNDLLKIFGIIVVVLGIAVWLLAAYVALFTTETAKTAVVIGLAVAGLIIVRAGGSVLWNWPLD